MIKKLLACIIFVALAGTMPLLSAPKRKDKKTVATPTPPVEGKTTSTSTETLAPRPKYDEGYQGLALKLACDSFSKLEPYATKIKPGKIDPNIATIITSISALLENIDQEHPSPTLEFLKTNPDDLLEDAFTTGSLLCQCPQKPTSKESTAEQLDHAITAINATYKTYGHGNELTLLGYWLSRCTSIIHGYQHAYVRTEPHLELNHFITISFLRGFNGEAPLTIINSEKQTIQFEPKLQAKIDNAYAWGQGVTPLTLETHTTPQLVPPHVTVSAAAPFCGAGSGAHSAPARYNEKYQERALSLARESLGMLCPNKESFTEGEIDPEIEIIIRCISSLLEKIDHSKPSDLLTELHADILNLAHAPFTALRLLPRYFQENDIDTSQFSTQLESAARALNTCSATYVRHNKTSQLSALLLEYTAIIHGYRYYAADESMLMQVGAKPHADLNLFISRSFLQSFYREDAYAGRRNINDAKKNFAICEEEEYEINNASKWGQLAGQAPDTSAKPPLKEPHSQYPYPAGIRDGLDHRGTITEKTNYLERCSQKYIELISKYSQKNPTLSELGEISYYDGYIQGLTKSIQRDEKPYSKKRILLPTHKILQHNYMKGYFTHEAPEFEPTEEYGVLGIAIVRGIALKLALRKMRQKGFAVHNADFDTLLYMKVMKKKGINLCFTPEDEAFLEKAIQSALDVEIELKEIAKQETRVAEEAAKRALEIQDINKKRYQLELERAAKKRTEQETLIKQYKHNRQERAAHNAAMRQAEKERLAKLKTQTDELEKQRQSAHELQATRPLTEEEIAAKSMSEAQFAKILEESRALAQTHQEALNAQRLAEKNERKRLRNARRKLRRAEEASAKEAAEEPKTLKKQMKYAHKNAQREALKTKQEERSFLYHLARTSQWRITQNNLLLQSMGPARSYILRECSPAHDYLYRYRLVPDSEPITPYQIGFFDGVTNMFHKICGFRRALKHKMDGAFDPAPFELSKARETKELYEIRHGDQEAPYNLSNVAYASGLEAGYTWIINERNNLFRKGLALANNDEESTELSTEIGLPHAFACIDGFTDNFNSTSPSHFPKMLKELLKQTLLEGKKVAEMDKNYKKTIEEPAHTGAGAGPSDGV